MGYTHYIRATEDEQLLEIKPDDWKAFTAAASNIAHQAFQENKVFHIIEVTDKDFHYNGLGEDSHESCYFTRKPDGGFNFCKTAAKPYDYAVVAVFLLYCDMFGWHFSSDGTAKELADGLSLVNRCTKRGIKLPAEID